MAKQTNTTVIQSQNALPPITCSWGGLTLKIPTDVDNEYENYQCCPDRQDIFKAFSLCPFSDVRVVILGQDPYPEKKRGKANGLAFSNNQIYDSLKSIQEEVQRAGFMLNSPDLTSWASQGVLLMNTCLSVRKGQAKSHHGLGWEKVISKVLDKLNQSSNPIIFLLWGNDAIQLAQKHINNPIHRLETASHPSRLKGNYKKISKLSKTAFNGCDHFRIANVF